MYSIEVNANPVIRDKNRFIKDVGRGLHPSPLPTELLSEIGILHASVSFSINKHNLIYASNTIKFLLP